MVFLNRPDGQADDFFYAKRSNFLHGFTLSGEVRTFSPQVGKVVTIAASIPAVDPIAQDRGRIFVGQSLSLSNTGL